MFHKIVEHKIYVTYIFILYAVSLCISKFGISFFGAILALLGVLYFLVMKDRNKDDYLIFGLYVLGIFLQFFSLGSIKSALFFITKNYFLLILIFFVYYLRKNDISSWLIRAVEIGLFVGILESFYKFYIIFGFTYSSGIRVDSFFDYGRWGIVLAMGLLLILPKLYKKDIFSWIVFVSGIFSLIINGSRGAILAFAVGAIFYLLFSKSIKTLLLVAIVMSIGISLNNVSYLDKFSARMNSIVDSNNTSNNARFFMWKENFNLMIDAASDNKRLFLFGIGIKNNEPIFKDYVTAKQSYGNLDEGTRSEVSFKEAHNAYLNMLTRTGIIYTTIYYFTLLYFTIKIFTTYIKTKNREILACLSVTVAFYFCGIFYGYAFTYETFLFFFIFGLGLYKARFEMA